MRPWGFEYLFQFTSKDSSGFFDDSSTSGSLGSGDNGEVILRMIKSGDTLVQQVDKNADGGIELSGSRDSSGSAYSLFNDANSSIYLSMRRAGTEIDYLNITVISTPEPGTLAMLGMGLPLLALRLRRRRLAAC